MPKAIRLEKSKRAGVSAFSYHYQVIIIVVMLSSWPRMHSLTLHCCAKAQSSCYSSPWKDTSLDICPLLRPSFVLSL